MIEVADVVEFIRTGEIPHERTKYTDDTFFCVEISSRHRQYGDSPCLCVSQVMPKQVPSWKIHHMVRLLTAVEGRADEMQVPVMLAVTRPEFGPALKERGYVQLNASVPVKASQTWMRVNPPEVTTATS